MSFNPLTQKELHELLLHAERGELDYSTASKRHVRILTGLHFTRAQDNEEATASYTNIDTIIELIEYFFQKRYTREALLVWINDLENREYVCRIDLSNSWATDQIDYSKIYYSLTRDGLELFEELLRSREELFESNSKNSMSSLH